MNAGARLAMFGLLALQAAPVAAEFYRWIDASGQARVSNVPPAQVRADGTIQRQHHPYSVGAQFARLRAELAREDAVLARVAAENEPAASTAALLPFDFEALRALGGHAAGGAQSSAP